MTHRQEVVLLHLVHYCASRLREQYEGRDEHSKFNELIAALEDPGTDAAPKPEEHGLGKLPALPVFDRT